MLNGKKDNEIEYLNWPAKSPDPNIIENIWGYYKDFCNDNMKYIHNKQDIWKFCH